MGLSVDRIVEVGMAGMSVVSQEQGIPVQGQGLKVHALDQDIGLGSQFSIGHYDRVNGNASRVPLVVSVRSGLHIPRDHSRSRRGNRR